MPGPARATRERRRPAKCKPPGTPTNRRRRQRGRTRRLARQEERGGRRSGGRSDPRRRVHGTPGSRGEGGRCDSPGASTWLRPGPDNRRREGRRGRSRHRRRPLPQTTTRGMRRKHRWVRSGICRRGGWRRG